MTLRGSAGQLPGLIREALYVVVVRHVLQRRSYGRMIGRRYGGERRLPYAGISVGEQTGGYGCTRLGGKIANCRRSRHPKQGSPVAGRIRDDVRAGVLGK